MDGTKCDHWDKYAPLSCVAYLFACVQLLTNPTLEVWRYSPHDEPCILKLPTPKWGTMNAAPGQSWPALCKSIKIDECGLQSGSCEGSQVLAEKEGSEVTLAIRPAT
jgi:hypothetical protein